MSFYKEIKGLDFTTGSPRGVPASLDEAFGRLMSQNEWLVALVVIRLEPQTAKNSNSISWPMEFVARVVMDRVLPTLRQ
jgi:hypothetical protein